MRDKRGYVCTVPRAYTATLIRACTLIISFTIHVRARKITKFVASLITGDRFAAAAALLGKEIAETFGAVGFLLARRKLLPSQHLVAVRTRETLAVPRCVLVRYPTFIDHLSNTGMHCK